MKLSKGVVGNFILNKTGEWRIKSKKTSEISTGSIIRREIIKPRENSQDTLFILLTYEDAHQEAINYETGTIYRVPYELVNRSMYDLSEEMINKEIDDHLPMTINKRQLEQLSQLNKLRNFVNEEAKKKINRKELRIV
jgi:hypothetical protein